MSVDYSRIDVVVMLEELGMNNICDLGAEVQFSCPFPGHKHGDARPSACMNKETTAYKCFGCGAKGNAVTFLSDFENVSPVTAARFLRERFEGGFREPRGSLWNELSKIINKPVQGIDDLPEISQEHLEARDVSWSEAWRAYTSGSDLPTPLSYFFDRGFSWETLDAWRIGFDSVTGRLSIPVHDERGRLVGFKGRSWHPEHHPKYLVLGGDKFGFPTYEVARVVFGMHLAKFSCSDSLILCEGELNCVALHQSGFRNAASIGAANFSDEQAKIIRHFTNEVVLFFDSDNAGMSATQRAVEVLEPYIRVRIVPSHEGDAAEMRREEIEYLIDNSVSSLQISVPTLQHA